MIRPRVGRILALLLALPGAAAWGADAISSDQATRQLLSMVPREMGGCIIVQDLAKNLHRFEGSTLQKRLLDHGAVKRWMDSPQYFALAQVRSLFPLYLGVSMEDFWDKVFGQAVVLAYRPGQNPGQDDVGILLVRATDSIVLDRLVTHLTRPRDGRTIRRFEHRGASFVRREESNGRVEYLFVEDAVAVVAPSEAEIRRAIDAKLDNSSLLTEPTFKEMFAALPSDAVGRFLIRPRAFDASMVKSGAAESAIGRRICDFWKAANWLGVSLAFDDAMHVGLHVSVDDKKLDSEARQWASHFTRRSTLWNRVPADCLAAASLPFDSVGLRRLLSDLIPANRRSDWNMVEGMFRQMLMGHDFEKDVLPRLGTELNVLVTSPTVQTPLSVVASLGLAPAPKKSGDVPLSIAIESAAHPLLVLIGVEQNQAWNDTWAAQTRLEGGVRVHYLSGSGVFPAWLQPGFAVTDEAIVLGSGPTAIAQWNAPAEKPFSSSPFAASLAKRFPASYDLKAYVNVKGLHDVLRTNRKEWATWIAKIASADASMVEARAEDLVGLTGLVERITFGSYADKEARHLVLSVFP